MAINWAVGDLSVRETGDPHIKENVRWLPGQHPYVGELVWYLKFGNDGIVIGSTIGDKIEANGVGAKYMDQATSDVGSSFVTASATFVDAPAGPTLTIDVVAGEPILVTISAMLMMDAAGVNGAVCSWQAIHIGSGTPDSQSDLDINGCETGVVDEWVPGSRGTIWYPVQSGQHDLKMRYRRIGSGNGNFKNRRIQFQRQPFYLA